MSDRARYWRPQGGYQDVPPPPSPPSAAHPSVPIYPQPMMFMPQGYYLPCPMPGAYQQGPIGIAGLCAPVPIASPAAVAPVQAVTAPASPPKKKRKPKNNPWAPPKLDDGVNYMFPKEEDHTMLHIFNKAAPVWKEKYRTQKLNFKIFKIFKVSVNFTPDDVIENTLALNSVDPIDWAITETYEAGDGQWVKGTTINYHSDNGKATLKSLGWSNKRGSEALPPVWLVVHKVDFK